MLINKKNGRKVKIVQLGSICFQKYVVKLALHAQLEFLGFSDFGGIFRKKVGRDFGGWDFFTQKKKYFKKNFTSQKLKFSDTLIKKNAIKIVKGSIFRQF